MGKINVVKCARCGVDHSGLELREFTEGPLLDSVKEPYPYFTFCPLYLEPILVRLKEVANGHHEGEAKDGTLPAA